MEKREVTQIYMKNDLLFLNFYQIIINLLKTGENINDFYKSIIIQQL